MNYSFCNLNFEIKNVNIHKSSIYDPFRFECNKEPDYIVSTCYKSSLDIPVKKPSFQNMQGLRVVLDRSVEYRYYSDFFTGEIRELLIDRGKQKELQILKQKDHQLLTELDLLNCLAFEKMMSEHQRFILHSSFIDTKKGAVLFTAPSGTGKSTQAELWYKYRNAEIINGDRAGIWKENCVWMAGGVPWCGTSGIMQNKQIPLRAIVILKQAKENEIKNIHFPYKVSHLLAQLTVNPWNRKMITLAQMFCMLLCQEVPVIQLSCRPDKEAVEILEHELERMV